MSNEEEIKKLAKDLIDINESQGDYVGVYFPHTFEQIANNLITKGYRKSPPPSKEDFCHSFKLVPLDEQSLRSTLDGWGVNKSVELAEVICSTFGTSPSKQCKCVYDSDCHAIEMIKSPSGKEWAIGGTCTQDRWNFCPWCGGILTKEKV